MVTQVYATDFSAAFFQSHTGINLTGISYEYGTSASTAGGDIITLTGTNFISGAQVYISEVLVSVSSVVSTTSITFVSPAKTTGTYVVNVVSADGGISTLIPGIEYATRA